ncbi:DUF4132 domain-containing protein [Olleya sp. Bg11-27]|uniref:DUF4132 domain-containing protein n=1 Tax=Olleya sp. Bg11-27 TaxID=2058135 RepID=UPI0012FE33C8|nr:DUF4132 domain-containing protein [Olleya sp. Bg11-27]
MKNFFSKTKAEQISKNIRFNSIASVLEDLKPKFTQANEAYKFQSYERELTRLYAEGTPLVTMSYNAFGRAKRDNYYFGSGSDSDYKNFGKIILQEPNNLEGVYLNLLKDLVTFHAASRTNFNIKSFDYLKEYPKEAIKELLPSLTYGLKYAGIIENSLQLFVAFFIWHQDVLNLDDVTSELHIVLDELISKDELSKLLYELINFHIDLNKILEIDENNLRTLDIESLSIYSYLNKIPRDSRFQIGTLVNRFLSKSSIGAFEAPYRSLRSHSSLQNLNLIDDQNFESNEKLTILSKIHQEQNNLEIRVDKRLTNNVVEPWFFEELWDFLIKERWINHSSHKNLKSKISQCIALFISAMPDMEKNWYHKLFSGFEQVAIPNRHDPYKGLHHSQIRPIFKLLQNVCEIDDTKFYTVGKESRVKFILNGNQYQATSTDGFGYAINGALNKILFEEKVPYQLVALERKVFLEDSEAYQQRHVLIITLVTEEEYKLYQGQFLKQDITGFATGESNAQKFIKNIESEKDNVRVKSNLDAVDLENDMRFKDFKPVIEKSDKKESWKKFLIHCLSHPLDKKAGKTWTKTLNEITRVIDSAELANGLSHFLSYCVKKDEWFLDEEKVSCLTGMAFAAILTNNPGTNVWIELLIKKCYKKVKGGAFRAKTGAVVLEYLAAEGSIESYTILGNLKAKATYNPFIKALNTRMNKFTNLLKEYTQEQLEDVVIPNFSLNEDYFRTQTIGDYQAKLSLEDYKTVLTFEKEGKTVKSVPKILREHHKGEVDELKAIGKGITESLKGQSNRIEKSWLSLRSWSFEDWNKYLIRNNFMKYQIEKLIWTVEDGHGIHNVLFHKSSFKNAVGEIVTLSAPSKVSLWHPATSTVEEVEHWRSFIFENRIKQPFKQAYREVYKLTPAEENTEDHSNRFLGQTLNGNTLYALGKGRMWTMSYEEAPYIKLPNLNLAGWLGVSGGVLYSTPTTEDVRFYKLKTYSKSKQIDYSEKVALNEIPEIIFSEVFRDIDLFVAVANFYIDPYLPTNTQDELLVRNWNSQNFGEKSKTPIATIRKQLLQKIIPMTNIAKQCSFIDNALVVEGQLKTYKINLGSGNILMEPNDQYLCIVPGSTAKEEKKVWLPFSEGDKVLMVILSKAFLLAKDDKITDSSILRQINAT